MSPGVTAESIGPLCLILDIYSRVGENKTGGMTIGSRRKMMIRRGKFILIMAFVSLYVVFSGYAEPPKTMSVQVKEGQLRSTPSFLAEIIAKPSYGDRVEIIQDQGPWKKVVIRGVQGWMHASSLTTKSIVLKAGAANVQTSATGSEIALAGKGFSEEVEKQYKSLNRNLDYAWVDRMEKFKVSPEQMQAFLKQGNVIPAEGGVQ
jgi:SH3-like domain-containing protein